MYAQWIATEIRSVRTTACSNGAFRHAPWGFDGGEPGGKGQFHMIDAEGKERRLPKEDVPAARRIPRR